MVKRRSFLIVISLMCLMSGCFQERIWLSDEIRSINPYRVEQQLIFVSSSGIEDTLTITNVEDGRFPDAIGAPLNEHLVVDAFRRSRTARDGTEERILSVLAKTDKAKEQIDFSISLKETSLRMKTVDFSEYQSRATINFSTDFGSYEDVLTFDNYPNRTIFDNEIVRFYWSKSVGYVRLIQNDGTTWDLKSIEYD